MSWTLCTSGAAIIKAGTNANSDMVISGAYLANFSDQAEGEVVAETRRNWVDDFASLSDQIKGILADITSSMIAKQIITYDMSGYTSRYEAQTMLDVQDDIIKKGLSILKDFKSNTIKSP